MARRSGRGRTFRILLLLVVLAAAYFAAAGFVVDRAAERLLTSGSVAPAVAGAAPMAIGYRGDPGKALGAAFEDVVVKGPDGPLPAWYLPGAGRIGAIYVHGIGGAREDGYRLVKDLSEAGLPVLMASYRGDPGAPAAVAHGFGLTEWPDLEAAAAFMESRGHDRLILLGDSMGAAIVGQMLKHSTQRGHVVALALDSPALDLPEVVADQAMQMHLPFPRTVARVALAIRRRSGGLDLAEARVTAVMAAFAGPVFLAHGTGDRVVPVAVSDRLLVARVGTTVTVMTGAGHLGSYAAGPEAYSRAFRAFLAALPERG